LSYLNATFPTGESLYTLREGIMALWALFCPNCRHEITHVKVEDRSLLDYVMPMKPKLPDDGLRLKCPDCGKGSKFFRHQLTYKNA
jgi:ribosomal protein S27AE